MYTSAIRMVISKTGPTVSDLLPASGPQRGSSLPPGSAPQLDNSLLPGSSLDHAKARSSLTSVNNWIGLFRTGTGELKTTTVLSSISNKTAVDPPALAGKAAADPVEQEQVGRGEGKGMMEPV